eukprot:3031906-Pyramimonas_sp.AAC.1
MVTPSLASLGVSAGTRCATFVNPTQVYLGTRFDDCDDCTCARAPRCEGVSDSKSSTSSRMCARHFQISSCVGGA